MSTRFSQAFPLSWSSDGYTQPVPLLLLGGANTSADGYTVSASFTTVPVWVKGLDKFSIQVSAPSGTFNLTFSFQTSNDVGSHENSSIPDNTLQNWTTAYFWDNASQTNVTSKTVSNAGGFSFMFREPVCDYRWIRMIVTVNSGSAVLTAMLQQKGYN